MQLEFTFRSKRQSPSSGSILVDGNEVPFELRRNHQAKRYILRVLETGTVTVTVPRWGTLKAAKEFAQENREWIAQQLQTYWQRSRKPKIWKKGSKVWYRGQLVRLDTRQHQGHTLLCLGDLRFPIQRPTTMDLRTQVEDHLRTVATDELTSRTWELSGELSIPISRVSVRSQRSRWGSCSARGTISLNWKLIQTPPMVSDYLIVHELVHRIHMNHSRRYWQTVGRVFPTYQDAEAWLKNHGDLIVR